MDVYSIMASQSVEENCEINVSPVVNQEPESEALDIYNSSHDSETDSREGLVRQDDQDVIQDQAYEERWKLGQRQSFEECLRDEKE